MGGPWAALGALSPVSGPMCLELVGGPWAALGALSPVSGPKCLEFVGGPWEARGLDRSDIGSIGAISERYRIDIGAISERYPSDPKISGHMHL